tara:strand:+ start:672 stop:818 length:147 start_codon:yes stop_codon:yes gene_type:complete
MSLSPDQENALDVLYDLHYEQLKEEGWTGVALILEAVDLAGKQYRGEE